MEYVVRVVFRYGAIKLARMVAKLKLDRRFYANLDHKSFLSDVMNMSNVDWLIITGAGVINLNVCPWMNVREHVQHFLWMCPVLGEVCMRCFGINVTYEKECVGFLDDECLEGYRCLVRCLETPEVYGIGL